MKLGKKIAAVATALALGLGGAVAVAAPASAHTGGVTGVASCEADGTYTIEWTYNANYVPNGVEAETKAMTTSSGSLAPIDGVNKGGQIFLSVWSDHQVNVPGAPVKTGNWSAKFKTVGIPGSFVGDVTTMVQTDWKNGPSEDPVGKVKLDGKCTPPAIKDAAASILTTPATCEANGTATWGTLLNATGSELVQTPGAQTGVATATTNHQFSDGSTVQNLPYTVEAKLDPTKPPCFTPPPPVINECVPGVGNTSTNLVPLWANVDTRAAGHYEYVEGGLHIWTDDASSQAKVSLGQAISFPLKNTGVLDLDWTGSTPPPGINLFVNFGADGNGTLVYESVYGQDLWLTNGSSAAVKANAPVNGGGNGSQWHGTIDQWLTKYPDATVTGVAFSLGSGVKGDGVINSITVNCAEYFFDYVEPAPKPEAQSEERVLTEVNCDTKSAQDTYQERHTVEPTFDPATNTWSEPVWTEWDTVGVEERAATTEECPAVVVPPVVTPSPTPSATPSDTPAPTSDVSKLAETGQSTNMAPVFWFIAVVVGLGAAFLIGSLLWRREHPVNTEV